MSEILELVRRGIVRASVVGVVTCALAAGAWAADGIRVEGEDYPAYGSNDLGGYPIGSEYCAGASQYYAADGIDLPGEWIMLEVSIPEQGCYALTLAYQCYYQDTVELAVKILDYPEPGQDTRAEFTLTDGWGFG